MGQRSNDAAVKDAGINLRRGDYALDTVRTEIITKNALLFHHLLDQIPARLLLRAKSTYSAELYNNYEKV